MRSIGFSGVPRPWRAETSTAIRDGQFQHARKTSGVYRVVLRFTRPPMTLLIPGRERPCYDGRAS